MPLINDRVVSGARFLTGGVFDCDIDHRRSVQYSVCCIRSGVTRCTLLKVLYLCRVCQCRLHEVLWAHISKHICSSSLQNIAVPQDLYSFLSSPVERLLLLLKSAAQAQVGN